MVKPSGEKSPSAASIASLSAFCSEQLPAALVSVGLLAGIGLPDLRFVPRDELVKLDGCRACPVSPATPANVGDSMAHFIGLSRTVLPFGFAFSACLVASFELGK